MGRRVYVLSDLHLGPGGPLTTFHEPGRLAALLRSWKSEKIDELVLAGDIFDFLQLPGYEGFRTADSAARLDTLLAHDATAAVVAAIGDLASTAGVELTVLAGNHDPELLVPAVRARFEDAVGRKGSVRWADDEPLRPRDGEHPPVWGRAVGPDGDPTRQVWIVHGDRWDPSNMIDRDVFKAAIFTGFPVALPAGSHLVFEVLSKLKVHHRWVDEVKPDLAVVPLLLALEPRATAGYLRRHYNIGGRLLVAQIKALLKLGPLFDEDAPAAAAAPTDVASTTAHSIAGELRAVDAADRADLLAELEALIERGEGPADADGTLAAPTGLRGLLVRAGLRAIRAFDRFGRLDGPDDTTKAAKDYLPRGLGALVAGHTHGARIRADLTPPYFNSGTWVPIRSIPADEAAFLDEITADDPALVPSPGTYVRIEVGDHPPRVAVVQAPP